MSLFKVNNTRALQYFQVIRFLGMFTIGIAMVKLSLSNKQIGYYELVLFISSVLSMFWITGIIQTLLPLFGASASNEKPRFIFNAFLVVLGYAIVTFLLGLFFRVPLSNLLGFKNFPFYTLALVYLALNSIASLVEYIYLLHNEAKKIVVYGAAVFGFQILCVIAPLFVRLDVYYSVAGLLLATFVRVAWLLALLFRYSTFKFDRAIFKKLFSSSLPLSLKYLVSSSGVYIDQAIVTGFFDSSTFAVYRFGAREIPLVTLLTVGLSNSLMPEIGNPSALKVSLEKLKVESRKLMHLLFPISMIAILLSKPLFPLIFSSDFADSAKIFAIYSLLIVSRSIFPQTVTMGLNRTKVILLASIVEMFLNILLSLFLIRYWGIEGVAMATVIVYLAEKVFLAAYNKFYLKISPSEYIALKPYFIYSLLILTVYTCVRFALF